MTGLDRAARSAWPTQLGRDEWPAGCSLDDRGAVRMHGIRLDELAAQWGTPLLVVDERALLRSAEELVQIRGARPLFGGGPLWLKTSRWAQRSGWDVWGDPAGLARAWQALNPERKVLDLRGMPRGADLPPAATRIVVDARHVDIGLLALAPSASIYLNIDGIAVAELRAVLQRLTVRGRCLPSLAGLAVQLEVDDSPGTAADRVRAAFAAVSSVVETTGRLIVDGGLHPDPLPIVRALVHTTGDRTAYDPVAATLLADLGTWLLCGASVALVRVDSARSRSGRQVVGLAGAAPCPSRALSRHVTAGRETVQDVARLAEWRGIQGAGPRWRRGRRCPRPPGYHIVPGPLCGRLGRRESRCRAAQRAAGGVRSL